MIENDRKYYNQVLWDYYDLGITQKSISLSSVFYDDNYKISPTVLQFSINDFQNRRNNHVMLSHRDIYLLLIKLKPITNDIKRLKEDIKEDPTKQESISIKTKKKIHISFLYRTEYEFCFRISFLEDGQSFSDADKVYIPFYDFLSLTKILVNFRDSYLSLANNSQLITSMTKLTDNVDLLTSSVTSILSELKQGRNYSQNSTNIQLEEKEKDMNVDILDDDVFDDNQEMEALQNNLETFLDNEKDNIDLDITIKEDHPPPEIVKASDDFFTAKFLKGDLKNLEVMMTNVITSDQPLDTIIHLIRNSCNPPIKFDDLIPNCSEKDYHQLLYITTRYLKTIVNKHLNEGKPLPQSVVPIRYKCDNINDINRSLMLDLFMYFVYYTQLKTQLQERDSDTTKNKSLICFTIKTILSPLVFTFFDSIKSREILISEITNRYTQYRNSGVFDNVEEEIRSRYGSDISISEQLLKDYIIKIHDVLSKNSDKFYIDFSFKSQDIKQYIKIPYEKFIKYEFSKEQIKKILLVESEYQKSGSLDIKLIETRNNINFQDIPDDILNCFGVTKETNNENLKRFINSEMKDSPYLNNALLIADSITTDYKDLKDTNVEFINFPENVLIAIGIWDMNSDRRLSTNYNYFKEKIESSSLDKATVLSLLTNIQTQPAEDYMGSLSATMIDD